VTSHERWIPHDAIKSRILALEHLRELNLPVEWHQRSISMPPLFYPAPVPFGVAVHDVAGVRPPFRLDRVLEQFVPRTDRRRARPDGRERLVSVRPPQAARQR